MKHADKTINGKYIINGVLTYSELDQEGGEVYSLMWATLTYNLWGLLCCGGGGVHFPVTSSAVWWNYYNSLKTTVASLKQHLTYVI